MKTTKLGLIGIVAAAVAWTQSAPPPQAAPPDAPQSAEEGQHGAARISIMQGDVSVRPGDAGELAAAAVNVPVVSLDRVATGFNSRAEVQFDGLNMIRLGSSSEVRIGDLQYKHFLVQ